MADYSNLRLPTARYSPLPHLQVGSNPLSFSNVSPVDWLSWADDGFPPIVPGANDIMMNYELSKFGSGAVGFSDIAVANSLNVKSYTVAFSASVGTLGVSKTVNLPVYRDGTTYLYTVTTNKTDGLLNPVADTETENIPSEPDSSVNWRKPVGSTTGNPFSPEPYEAGLFAGFSWDDGDRTDVSQEYTQHFIFATVRVLYAQPYYDERRANKRLVYLPRIEIDVGGYVVEFAVQADYDAEVASWESTWLDAGGNLKPGAPTFPSIRTYSANFGSTIGEVVDSEGYPQWTETVTTDNYADHGLFVAQWGPSGPATDSGTTSTDVTVLGENPAFLEWGSGMTYSITVTANEVFGLDEW